MSSTLTPSNPLFANSDAPESNTASPVGTAAAVFLRTGVMLTNWLVNAKQGRMSTRHVLESMRDHRRCRGIGLFGPETHQEARGRGPHDDRPFAPAHRRGQPDRLA